MAQHEVNTGLPIRSESDGLSADVAYHVLANSLRQQQRLLVLTSVAKSTRGELLSQLIRDATPDTAPTMRFVYCVVTGFDFDQLLTCLCGELQLALTKSDRPHKLKVLKEYFAAYAQHDINNVLIIDEAHTLNKVMLSHLLFLFQSLAKHELNVQMILSGELSLEQQLLEQQAHHPTVALASYVRLSATEPELAETANTIQPTSQQQAIAGNRHYSQNSMLSLAITLLIGAGLFALVALFPTQSFFPGADDVAAGRVVAITTAGKAPPASLPIPAASPILSDITPVIATAEMPQEIPAADGIAPAASNIKPATDVATLNALQTDQLIALERKPLQLQPLLKTDLRVAVLDEDMAIKADITPAQTEPNEPEPMTTDTIKPKSAPLEAIEPAPVAVAAIKSEPVTTATAASQAEMEAQPKKELAQPATAANTDSDTVAVTPTIAVSEYVRRGEALLALGDVAGARLLFQAAAESGDINACLAVGTTYDPLQLAQYGLTNVYVDPEQALQWYKQAQQGGHLAAAEKLNALQTWLTQNGVADSQ